MVIRVDVSALRRTRWYELGTRFALGGLITVGAGLISKAYGPALGGLFLAFPAIFPASATLLAKHEREKKERQGLPGANRGSKAAAVEAAGAVMGSLGLVAFAALAWWLIPRQTPPVVFPIATTGWAAAAGLAWLARHYRRRLIPGRTSPGARASRS